MSPGIDQITVKLIQAQGAVLCSEIYIYIYIYTHTHRVTIKEIDTFNVVLKRNY